MRAIFTNCARAHERFCRRLERAIFSLLEAALFFFLSSLSCCRDNEAPTAGDRHTDGQTDRQTDKHTEGGTKKSLSRLPSPLKVG